MRGPSQSVVMLLAASEVVLARVLHGEQFGKFPPIAGDQPIFVVGDGPLVGIVLLNEVGDDFNDQVVGESVQMQLHRVGDLQPAPVVVELDLNGLVFLVDKAGEQILYTRIFGERNMRPLIEQKSVRVTKRRRMAAEICRLVVNNRLVPFGVQFMRRAKAGHAGTKNNNVCH